jgi:hypothetical protein
MPNHIFSPIKAGAAYFAVVFALGFVLGAIRVLWLSPIIGETAAVVAEQPVMLTASWFVARWLVRQYDFAHGRERLVMGGCAFAMLMVAELLLAVALFGQTPGQWLDNVVTMPGPIGLAGQMMFGLMPLVVRRDRLSH